MKQEEIFKKIGTILHELEEQYLFIEKTKDNINDLELELFAANTHYLLENIEVLRKYNQQRQAPPMPEEEPPFTEKFFEPVVQPAPMFWPEKKEMVENTPEPEKEEPQQPVAEPVIKHQLVLDDTEIDDIESEITIEPEQPATDNDIAIAEEDINLIPEPVTPVKPAEASASLSPVLPIFEAPRTEPETPEPVSTKPDATVPETVSAKITINELIASKMQSQRLADQFGQPAISDLKGAITLNDKLLYVKDLFSGYSMAYGEAIEILNRFNTFEEADAFLQTNYVKKNNWENKQTTADKFYILLRRRFPN